MRSNNKVLLSSSCIARIKSSEFYITLGPNDVSLRTASIVNNKVNRRLKWLRMST